MSVVLQSSGGGSVTLQEPATASNFTLNLPAVTGTAVTTGDTGTVTPTMLSEKLTQATAQNSTSGTSIDFTGIPSWATRITVVFSGVSTSGTSNPIIQLGTSGGFVTSGYLGAVSNQSGGSTSNFTSGFMISVAITAADIMHGEIGLVNVTGNTWVERGITAYSNQVAVRTSAGSIALAGILDRVRITTVNGTDTFDAGSINIMWE